MAVGLDLAGDYFEGFTDTAVEAVRINYFEGRPGDTAMPSQFGIAPHTDYGIVTVLLTDSEPALQVYTGDGQWQYVVPVPGTLVVNVGGPVVEMDQRPLAIDPASRHTCSDRR